MTAKLLRLTILAAVGATVLFLGTAGTRAADPLEQGFTNPPPDAKLRAYWWWLNGYVTKASLTRDLEEMAAKGFGGALICDAGGAEQDGNDPVPHGPDFFSPEWRELYKHTLREAQRLGLEMSLNVQSGWNMGGPLVKPEQAPKKIVWSELKVKGPARIEPKLPMPKIQEDYYRDWLVVAYPVQSPLSRSAGEGPGVRASGAQRGSGDPSGARRGSPDPAETVDRQVSRGNATLSNWHEKAGHRTLHFSAPDTTPLLIDEPDRPGEEASRSADVIELTEKLDSEGVLRWDVPEGQWQILRFGATLSDRCHVSTCSDNWKGYAIDPLDADAFRFYWNAIVEPLIADAGPLAGSTLKYLHTDSWEIEPYNWTPTMRDEFRKRCGYDLAAMAPALAGRIIDSRSKSVRFLNDYRRVLGDLAIDNHYVLFRDGAHRHKLLIHPESGGPHAVPIDAQRCLGMNDAPMSEFWAWCWRHRVGDINRFFVKQPASAAHTYGRRFVLAEGFTTLGAHWQETLWDNLKPTFDQACCEGFNRLVWHAFTNSPEEAGMPGIQYFAGTHFNPNTTWWSRSGPFLAYINRCQFMLQQGLFVADACYYYGDHVPNFAQLKRMDPAKVLPGYDYDVATEEVVLTRMAVKDGRIVLPDGMSYRVLVLPDRRNISLAVLRKLKELVAAGATVVGPKPEHATGLSDFPNCDEEVATIAAALWGKGAATTVGENGVGRGRIVWGKTGREVLLADQVKPDFEFTPAKQDSLIDYIHRRDGEAEVYFVANRHSRFEECDCTFRIVDKQPELWNPLDGTICPAVRWWQADGRITVPLEFAPCGSHFVVFRKPAQPPAEPSGRNFPRFSPRGEITGPWTVRFDPKWGGPASVEFAKLTSWPDRPEEGIQFYSGTATYEKTFDLPAARSHAERGNERVFLDLGRVKELAEVRLNGKSLGVLWAFPFRVDVTDAIQPTGNRLEIDVVNFWPNRIIGDALLPPEKRLTRTNVRKLTADTPPPESGLLGPVTLQTTE